MHFTRTFLTLSLGILGCRSDNVQIDFFDFCVYFYSKNILTLCYLAQILRKIFFFAAAQILGEKVKSSFCY
jgi:hypothetical protein